MTYFTKTFLILFGVLGVVGNFWAYYARQAIGTTCSGQVCLSLVLPSFVSAMTAILAVGVFIVALAAQALLKRKGTPFTAANKIYAGAVFVLTALYSLVGYVWYIR